jgi:CRP/FNR family cyclic AMP-dependent transcriptional regulator
MIKQMRVKAADCVDVFLKSLPVFLQADDEALGEIRKRLYKRSCGRGKTVFQRGDAVSSLFIVETGQIEIFKTDDDYRRLTLWHIGPGELFCVPSLLNGTAIANAEVVKDALFYCLDKKDFEELLERFPRIAAGFLKCLSGRIIHYSQSVDTIAFTSASARVADVLLKHHDHDGKGNAVCSLSRDEIISMTGACRETVSRTLNKFKKENIIALERRKILVLDLEGLKRRYNPGL